MRRILAFLIAKRNLLLFIFLELIALGSIFRFHRYQRSLYLNNANAMGASLNATQTKWTNYFNLEELNTKLHKQNQGLLVGKQDTLDEIITDSFGWFAKLNLHNFEVIDAEIIFNSTNRPVNTFVINKGSRDGIEKGLGVSSTQGIIGKIIEVNQNYALGLSILNVKSPVVMPKISELTNKSGSIEWDGLNPKKVRLKGIHKFENVEKGNHVVSSGYSINFPENIPVGTISKLNKTNESFFQIEVDLAANLAQDKFVYVFKNRNRKQIDSLISNPQIMP
ncbi:rod shape-determining protein MreC [Bacteroidia bacterium]|jgi:rod shape-determining protein MreC|nr:rod shape-determining protein MreC [Bacteroidia bacterium]